MSERNLFYVVGLNTYYWEADRTMAICFANHGTDMHVYVHVSMLIGVSHMGNEFYNTVLNTIIHLPTTRVINSK